MKRYLILLIALLLAGCDADQKQVQLARCVYDAETSYPSATWLLGDTRQSYVWLCMAAHGYTLNRGQDTCVGKFSLANDAVLYAQCYEPSAKFSSLLYQLEKTLGR
jgi:hypothetical protein